MVTKQLSFIFYYKNSKNILSISSIITNILIFLFAINYLFIGTNNKFEIFIFSLAYVSTSSILTYFLMKSRRIAYDSKFIYIEQKPNIWLDIEIQKILKIKRTFYYFYTIFYLDSNSFIKKVVFFISPNPSLYRSEKVKEVLKYAN